MSLRDYDGWRRYSKWKRENRDAWERSIKQKEINMATVNKQITDKVEVKNIEQMPDQKWHRRISFIKSGIRIVGYLVIPFNILAAVALLVVSEAVGIVEELV
jgi:cell division protein FtsX